MAESSGNAIYLSVMSGFFATAGSLFGKLAGGVTSVSAAQVTLKLILFGIMIILNTTGCTLFVRSLVGCSSSLSATVVSAATNYFLSALAGFIFFNETTSLLWWCGTSLVLLGLIIVCISSGEKIIKSNENKKDR